MAAEKDLREAVAALYDVEVTPETVRAAADELGQLIRYLNAAAAEAGPAPEDTARLIGALHDLAAQLRPALERIAAHLGDGGDEEARRAVAALAAARDGLGDVTRHLGRAHAAATQIPE